MCAIGIICMALEDYIHDQEKKAKNAAEDVRASAEEAWEDTKDMAEDAKDKTSDFLNG